MNLKEIMVESKTDVPDGYPTTTNGIAVNGMLTNSMGEGGIEIEQLADDEGAQFHQSFEESGNSSKESSQMVCSGQRFSMEK